MYSSLGFSFSLQEEADLTYVKEDSLRFMLHQEKKYINKNQ